MKSISMTGHIKAPPGSLNLTRKNIMKQQLDAQKRIIEENKKEITLLKESDIKKQGRIEELEKIKAVNEEEIIKLKAVIDNIDEDVIINTANIEEINATAIEDKNITESKYLFWLKQVLLGLY